MRAAVVVIDGDSVLLIERIRDGRRYYLFPGGTVEPGETAERAAIRESFEELGLTVEVIRPVARATFGHTEQIYFLARATGGTFGTGTVTSSAASLSRTRGRTARCAGRSKSSRPSTFGPRSWRR